MPWKEFKFLKCQVNRSMSSSGKSKFTNNSNIPTSSSFMNPSLRKIICISLWKWSREPIFRNSFVTKVKKVNFLSKQSFGNYSSACCRFWDTCTTRKKSSTEISTPRTSWLITNLTWKSLISDWPKVFRTRLRWHTASWELWFTRALKSSKTKSTMKKLMFGVWVALFMSWCHCVLLSLEPTLCSWQRI